MTKSTMKATNCTPAFNLRKSTVWMREKSVIEKKLGLGVKYGCLPVEKAEEYFGTHTMEKMSSRGRYNLQCVSV